MNNIDIIAHLSDMKDIDYRNTLAIASIIEVLIEKGIIKRNDIAIKARQLEVMSIEEIQALKKSSLCKVTSVSDKFL
ncbi:hypothetical protein [Proteiniborus sp.]|uniref:hypothetical protein n=1 Tax=Proteiniborus sp. TaxID=2079015 RepID=UPI0033308D51